ncbi:MAG: hypothetical protein A2534_05225, partial [Candidatus Magasanikbacteria bacterium RIFOXYD2_FULL_39_9]
MDHPSGSKIQRQNLWKNIKKLPIFLLFGLVLFFAFANIFNKKAEAANAPLIITYQGKLLVSNRLATTTQDMTFVLYDAATSGNILYTASGTIGSPAAVSTTPSQGLFSINLGDTNTNPLEPAIFSNNTSVYLEVRVGSDTLTPRKRITATPYAFNSKYLDGIGVNTLSSTVYIPKSDSVGNFAFNSTTVSTSTILNSLNVLGSSSFSTITAGLWNGTAISSTYGGTGTNTLAWSGLVRITNGTWSTSTVTLTTEVTGILPIANGGTNSSTIAASGALIYSDGTSYNATALGSSGQILQSIGGGTPIWVSTSSLGLSSGFIMLQAVSTGSQQIGNFNISGTGIIGTSFGVGTSTVSSTLTVQGSGLMNPFTVVSSTGQSLFRVLTNGNIGIGTSTPTEKLSVVGNISNVIGVSTSIAQVGVTSTGSGPTFVFVSGKYAYTANYFGNNISVIDITNPTAPKQIATTSVGESPISIFVSGRYAYVANYYTDSAVSGTISIVDISNPAAPREVATTSFPRVASMYVSGHYLYVVNFHSNTLGIIDVSNPLMPIKISEIAPPSIPSNAISIYVSGKYAYLANQPTVGSGIISIVDVSNPYSPSFVASTTIGKDPSAIAVSGRYAYVANYTSNTISVVDVSNPAAPVQVATTSVGTNPQHLFVSGRYVYVANYTSNDVSVIDVANPTAPVRVATVGVGLNPYSVFVSGRYAYTANSTGDTLSIIDISGTEATSLIAHSAEVGNLQSRNDIFAQGNIMAGTSLMVGAGGIMSQGSVSIFASSTGVTSTLFSIDSAQTQNIFRAYAGGRIVMGTSTPIAKLTIQGTGLENPLSIVSSSPTMSSMFTILTNGSVGINTSSPISTFAVQGVGGGINPFTVVSSSGSSLLTILTNGRVGINSSSPMATLSVQGDISITGGIYDASSTLGTNGQILYSNGTVVNWVSTSTLGFSNGSGTVNSGLAGQFPYYATNGTAVSATSTLFILPNGNIGVGTTTPTQRLSVVGSISNVMDPSTVISIMATTSMTGGIYDVFVSGRYAYVVNDTAGTISVVDVSNPAAPIEISTGFVGNNPRSVYVSGRYAYVTNFGDNTMSIVDISDPSTPTQVSAIDGGGTSIQDVVVSGRYAYIANSGSLNVSIIDISNPLFPKLVTTTSAGGDPYNIFVSDRYVYTVNNGSNSISVIDVSNPSVPVLMATTSVGTGPLNISVSGRYAYVTNVNANTISVVDIFNPSTPIQVATTSAGTNPVALFVSGRYAYVLNGTPNTLSVIDILNSSTPRRINTTAAGFGGGAIYVSGRYAYITNNDTDTFSVVDISGTEVTSLIAHSVEVGNLQARNDIFAQGNIMAGTSLTVGSGGIMSQGSLSVFSSATGPTSTVFSVDSAGAPNIIKVLANGNVGIGTSTPSQKLSVVGNISNIVGPGTVISRVATTSVGNGPNSIFVSGKYAYTANFTDNNITIVDVSNPAAPIQISSTTAGTGTYSVFVSGRYAYTANFSSNNISVIDVSNPTAPRQVSTVNVGTSPYSIYVSGKYAYVANFGSSNVSIVDISNPVAPRQISTVNVEANPQSIYVSGRYAYTANASSNTISVIDISNPSAPVQVATTSVGEGPHSIYVSGRYAYVANSTSNTISVVDISNPTAPVQVATTSVSTQPESIFVSGRYAYLSSAAVPNVISILDVSNPLAPRVVVSTSIDGVDFSIYLSGRYLYSVNSDADSISIIDISGTEVTSLIAHSAEVGNIQSRNDVFAQGNIMAGTSLNVGAGGIMSQGALSIFASSTGATSSIFSIDSAASSSIFRVFSNGKIGIGTSTPTATLDVQGELEVDLYSPAGATSALCHSTNGTSTNQVIYDCNTTAAADYMEMYAADVGLQLGDVVALSTNFVTTQDGNSIPKLSKATSAYQTGLVGVISDSTQIGDFNSIGHNVEDADNPLPLALSGRVLIKVTNANGDIHVGDKLTSSNIPGVAMLATEEGPTIAIAMGDYTSSEVGTVMGFINISWNNKLYSALTVDTTNNVLTVGTAANPFNLIVTGDISLSGTSVVNKLSFATSTLFESSASSFSGSRAFTFNAVNFTSPLSDNYIISLRANNTSVFSVAANGDVHAAGNYFGASAILGTSTNPGDLAERVDIAIDDVAEAGDVMMVDRNNPDTYRRSDANYEQSVAGVISTNPTIVVGNGKTDYTAVLAMVGRVPVKVTTENGPISRGDLLVSASRPGYAMKYDPSKDKNNKVVGIIGLALEPLPTSTGKILSLIRTGWVYNRDQAITEIKDDIEEIATAQGINLSEEASPENLNIHSTNSGNLAYNGGNLDLQNNSIINVSTIIAKNNKWRIDESGNLIQKITTTNGEEKETYGLQSTGKQEIIISGTSTLENGTRRVILTDLDQSIIDRT